MCSYSRMYVLYPILEFIIYSLVSTVGFCGSYKIIEQFPPLWPNLYEMPLLAALLGADIVQILHIFALLYFS